MSKQKTDSPVCWIIAGPNGAGKTTFALDYLLRTTTCRKFINADLIASGLAPLDPQKEQITASKIYLSQIRGCINKTKDFAFETTLSGRGYLRIIKSMKQSGWQVNLIYLVLSSPELSRLRVGERVASGGHDIPTEAINRIFPRSLYNLFELYKSQVDYLKCYLNDGNFAIPVFECQREVMEIFNQDIYNSLRQKAGL